MSIFGRLFGFGSGSASSKGNEARAPASQLNAIDAAWERASRAMLSEDGLQPDAVLRCTVQSGGDGSAAEFTDILVGAFREGRFLRFVMRRDDEEDYDPETDLHSWDVPFDRIFAVILRERTSPGFPFKTPRPDGSYWTTEPYYQTRLYTVGRGMECRLLDAASPRSRVPFDWVQANLSDPEIRFASDSQDDALYGDTAGTVDRLDEYVNRLKTRSQMKEHQALAREAVTVSDARLRALVAASPEGIRTYLGSPENAHDLDRWIAHLTEKHEITFSPAQLAYVQRVTELVLVGTIPASYYGVFFYDNFPDDVLPEGSPRGTVKGLLLSLVRYGVMKFNPSLS